MGGKEWIGFSDLMSVLMMVFMFIAIVFMLQVDEDKKTLQEQHQAMSAIAQGYDETRNGLYETLRGELGDDLAAWRGELLANGALRFNHPDVFFLTGSARLNDAFKESLRGFFPRYIAALAESPYRDEIAEIRIVGHTSSDWGGGDASQKYIENARLSQARAFAVLNYVYHLPAVAAYRPWLQRVLRANGAAYAAPVVVDGREDAQQSRRVEFLARLRPDDKLDDILRQVQ